MRTFKFIYFLSFFFGTIFAVNQGVANSKLVQKENFLISSQKMKFYCSESLLVIFHPKIYEISNGYIQTIQAQLPSNKLCLEKLSSIEKLFHDQNKVDNLVQGVIEKDDTNYFQWSHPESIQCDSNGLCSALVDQLSSELIQVPLLDLVFEARIIHYKGTNLHHYKQINCNPWNDQCS